MGSCPVDYKGQNVRLADVFIIGPVMIGVALSEKPKPVFKAGLLAFGVATILYNLNNYIEEKERG